MNLKSIFGIKFFKVLFILYLILKPFYLFDSGSPQIADFLIIATIIFYFLVHKPAIVIEKKVVIFLSAFLVIISIVNFCYALLPLGTYEFEFVRPIVFYGFNAILFVFCILIFKHFTPRDFRIISIVILFSLLVQFLLIILDVDKGIENRFLGRDYNFFNNPNQLSYYTLLLITFLFFLYKKGLSSFTVLTLSFSLALVIIVFATSLPALLGIFILFILFIIDVLRFKMFKALLLVAFFPLMFLLIKQDNVEVEYRRIFQRFESPEERIDNSYADRGYVRVITEPHFLLYGAGEGNYGRFVPEDQERPQEIHNSLLNMLFSYGVLGLLAFGFFLFHTLKNIDFHEALYLIPIVIYNMAHNGIRFSLFWVFLALLLYIGKDLKKPYK